jgi:hypothetical protein
MSWEGWKGHLHSTPLRRAAHERKIGTYEGSDEGTARPYVKQNKSRTASGQRDRCGCDDEGIAAESSQ